MTLAPWPYVINIFVYNLQTLVIECFCTRLVQLARDIHSSLVKKIKLRKKKFYNLGPRWKEYGEMTHSQSDATSIIFFLCKSR